MYLNIELRPNNPYSVGDVFVFPEGDAELERKPIQTRKSTRDRYYRVEEGDTLSDIAFDAYGDSKYYWVISDVNNLDWVFELPVGTLLLIPDIIPIKALN